MGHMGHHGERWIKASLWSLYMGVGILDGTLEVMHVSDLKRRLLDLIFQHASQNAVETAEV